MSITFGYDLKEGDKIVEAPDQITYLTRPFAIPGSALVNYLPFCEHSNLIPVVLAVSNSHIQCGAFPRGSHISAINHWGEQLGTWV